MSISENFGEKNRPNRKIFLILFLVGIILLISIPILVNQIFPRLISPFAKPKYLEIQIPDNNQRMIKNRLDSVLSVYLLGNDSVVLQYTSESKITNLKNIDSFLNKKNFKFLLIKPSPNSGYNSIVTIIDKITEAHIKKYAIGNFNKNELDSILRTKN